MSIADQAGQDTVELAGLLILAAAIFAIFWTVGLPGKVAHAVQCAVDEIFLHESCTAERYPVSVQVKNAGYDGRVAIVDGGHSYTVTYTRYSDGTSSISAVNEGSLGVSARIGAKVELGPLGDAGAEATAGAGGYLDGSTTWSFPSWSAGDRYWSKVSGGSGLGLAGHDAFSSTVGGAPLIGGWLTGEFDSLTGASGAPGPGSLPGRYLSSTALGGGAEGTASAQADVNLGPLSAGVSASLAAHAGLEHIQSGPDKGDWQVAVTLDGNADGSLLGSLFGPSAEAAGTINGNAVVTFGPGWQPLKLEVAASGDGVWDVAGPSNTPKKVTVEVPGASGGDSGSPSGGTGGSASGGGGSASGGGGGSSAAGGSAAPEKGSEDPVLDLHGESSGGSGSGSSFVGTLDLSNDPQAQADLGQLLAGNTSSISALIADMNSRGTESIQTYTISRSNSSVGGEVDLGGGGGGEISDGSSTATYSPPRVRTGGGKWEQESS